jgi:hypothetical protein
MAIVNNGPDVPQKSNGLPGLSHFRNSRVATSLWEPIYQNLFSVSVVPPAGLEDRSEERVNIILEGVQSVGTITSSKASSAVEQKYKFATRSYANATPEGTTIDLQIQFALNLSYDNGTPENYTYKFLRQWVDLVYDPLTGRQGLKKDYAAGNVVVTMHDRAGTPYWQWIFYYVWPTTGAPTPSLSYTNTTLMEGSMTFRCDWWDECVL